MAPALPGYQPQALQQFVRRQGTLGLACLTCRLKGSEGQKGSRDFECFFNRPGCLKSKIVWVSEDAEDASGDIEMAFWLLILDVEVISHKSP